MPLDQGNVSEQDKREQTMRLIGRMTATLEACQAVLVEQIGDDAPLVDSIAKRLREAEALFPWGL